MNSFYASPDRFFFERVSANGWGLMRITWAAVALLYFCMQWPDVAWYYSAEGIASPAMWDELFRNDFRFTILSYVTSPQGVFAVYLALLAALVLTLVGYKTRLSLIVSVVLLFSFHERNLFMLGGGDTVLRVLGFLLVISPEVRAFSVDRLKLQWKYYRAKGELLPSLTMSIWPIRMLLWQYIVLYGTSGWDKLRGDMWLDGTAVASVLHHTDFSRWPMPVMNLVSVSSPIMSYGTLAFEFAWVLLLIPRSVWARLPQIFERHSLRRALLFGGLLFHGAIFVMMDVGSFSLAMLAGYVGLLLRDDFRDLRHWRNRRWDRGAVRPGEDHPRILVLYDGVCRLCRRSLFVLLMLDRLDRLRPVDFHETKLRRQLVPDLKTVDLDRSMHVRFPQGLTAHGFDGVRALSWHLPPLWPIVPFLYLPGIAPIGRKIYARIAENRLQCSDGACVHK